MPYKYLKLNTHKCVHVDVIYLIKRFISGSLSTRGKQGASIHIPAKQSARIVAPNK